RPRLLHWRASSYAGYQGRLHKSGGDGQARRRPRGLSLRPIWAQLSLFRYDSSRLDAASTETRLLSQRGCHSAVLRISDPEVRQHLLHGISDLDAPQLALALARYIRLVHAETSVQAVLS